MRLELVSFVLCPFVQRAVIALREMGVAHAVTDIDPDDPPDWFRAISPFGKVPLLRVGEAVLLESAIINEYLDEVYPPRLARPSAAGSVVEDFRPRFLEHYGGKGGWLSKDAG